ncbi:MAG TPA: dihydroorotate dehydrogenase electron transfer subunit [Candidatus Omnitrophota bacterium]|nr:dihydroorotate dehydrogenase electron transfer subunit [Candidatus Omnitrophota bacterium]HPD84493.1 dihydroorotate dehydrogenase electron transfer subunit [Candidatus Omnitrophota bacterium]HRZ03351.1 dihydroorotate dehydrogenase electron transfer subunit [Candidatus Omnitrophota bacterium]
MPKIQNKFRIISNKKVCQRFHRLCLDAKAIAKNVRPGQFIHIRVSDGITPLFRRPFSVFRARKGIEILYETVGRGTEILASRKSGEYLDVLGPLGNSFSMPPKGTRRVVMIGGGVGVAPMLALSDALAKKGYELVLLYGARTKGHIFKMDEFKKNGCKVFIATNDGSVGVKGYVSKLFSKIETNPQSTVVYTCGPHPMLAAVKQFVLENNLRCEVSCEEVMACGLGACLGCSIKTTDGYRTTCHDGPVFDINKIIF